MSDGSIPAVLAALSEIRAEMATGNDLTGLLRSDVTALHSGLTELRADVAMLGSDVIKLRGDLMARMDGHAKQLTAIRDDIAVATGYADSARKTNATFRGDIQFLTEQIIIMERQIQRLQTDVRGLKG